MSRDAAVQKVAVLVTVTAMVVCLWAAVLYIPAGLDIFFRSGLFAWNGLVASWIPAIAYRAWFLPMVICTPRAIDDEPRAEPAASSALQPVLAH